MATERERLNHVLIEIKYCDAEGNTIKARKIFDPEDWNLLKPKKRDIVRLTILSLTESLLEKMIE